MARTKAFWLLPDTISQIQKFGEFYETQDSVVRRLIQEHRDQQKTIKQLKKLLDDLGIDYNPDRQTPVMIYCQYCHQPQVGLRAMRLHEKTCPKKLKLEALKIERSEIQEKITMSHRVNTLQSAELDEKEAKK